jgi:Zn-dependent protease with chaperone function
MTPEAILGVTILLGCAFFLSLLGTAAGALASTWPRSALKEGHWTERARKGYPARYTASVATALLPLVWAATGHIVARLLQVQAFLLVVPAASSALAGSLIVLVAVERRVRPSPPSWLRIARGWLARMVVMLLPLPLLLVITYLLPARMNARAVGMLAGSLGLFAFLVFGGGLWLGRPLGLTKAGRPRLRGVVEGVSARLGIPFRGVHEFGLSSINAVAFPLPRLLAFSEAAVDTLSDEELGSVAAHELGHLSESRLVGLARAGWFVLILAAGSVSPIVGSFGAGTYLAVLVAASFGHVGLLRLARRMETRADKVAHEADPQRYALTLERIYELNMVPAVLLRRGAAHQDLYDRLLAAGVTPAYPRPERPSRDRQRLGLIAMMVVAVGPPLAFLVVLVSL